MKLLIRVFFLVLFASTINILIVLAQPTIYIVRHAEKLPNWPGDSLQTFQPLSREGIARAEKLAKHFDTKSLTAIYSSMTTRTLHTALPLAQKLKLTIKVAQACMDTSAIDEFFAELKKQYGPNRAILLVTHSNIIPYMLMKAGLPGDCQERMGFTTSPDHSWIVIKGYDHIWKVERLGEMGMNCEGFKRIKF
ncbi:MAG: histidine phosphatase family protein [bacterium]